MRISVDRDDPGYTDLAKARGVRVFLDGIERSHVVTADEERRELVRFVTDQHGRIGLNEARDDIKRETLRGSVRIEIPDHPQRFLPRP